MKLSVALIIITSLLVSYCLGQEKETTKPKSRGPKPMVIPFHMMSKSAGFTILRADKSLFIEMESVLVTVNKDLNPQLTKPTNIVQLTYGYKKSGISCVYLAAKVGSLTAEQVFQPLIDKKILKDRQYFKGWCISSVPNSKLLVMVSGTTNEVRDAMIHGLK